MFEFKPAPKPEHQRRIPKWKVRTNFSEKTKKAIFERDNYECVKCGSHHLEHTPHHVIYRSQLGNGSMRNGVTICRSCHEWAHMSKKQNNEWFTRWVELNLDSEGNMRFPVARNPDLFLP